MFSKSKYSSDIEKQALLQDVQPRLMRYGDLSRTADAAIAAMADDPMFQYVTNVPDKKHTPFSSKMFRKRRLMFSFARQIRLKMILVATHIYHSLIQRGHLIALIKSSAPS